MNPLFSFSFLLLLIWSGFLIFSKETRKEQLLMSVVGLILTPGALNASLSFRAVDPQWIFIEIYAGPLLAAWSLFGIAAVCYQVAAGKSSKPVSPRTHSTTFHWFTLLCLLAAGWILTSFVALAFLQIPTIPAISLGGLLVGLYLIAHRHDLLIDALGSGAIMALVVLLGQLMFSETFFTSLQPSQSFGLAVLQEVSWAAIVGFSVGPLYEYVKNFKLA
jgi:hypothetical protein